MAAKFLTLNFIILFLVPIPGASASQSPRDHELLQTLQTLTEASIPKRLASFAAMGPASYRHLRNITFDSSYTPEVRAEAFVSMVSLGGSQSLPEIQKAQGHKEWFLRALALKAYESVKPPKARELAREMLLHDPALMVRAAALQHLESLAPTPGMAELFQAALEDDKNFHRGQSLWIRTRISAALAAMEPQ